MHCQVALVHYHCILEEINCICCMSSDQLSDCQNKCRVNPSRIPGRPAGNKESVVLTGYDVIRETGVRTGLCEESVVIPNSSLPPGRWCHMYCMEYREE